MLGVGPVAVGRRDRADAGFRPARRRAAGAGRRPRCSRARPIEPGLITGNGRDAASISVSQQVGANILEIETGVQQAVDELARALPAGLHITKVYDLAEFVRASIANVRDAILIGGFLAVVILLLFLRDWRLTLVAAITLPLAVLMTFVVMRLFGESINLMSMGGLAVAIGLVIDDAVVVVEGIHRRVQEGSAAPVADAITDLTAPVVSSTLTTVVVFAPLGLLSGRGRTVLPRAVADAVGRGARLAGARADADSAARALGHPAVGTGGRASGGRLDRRLRAHAPADARRARCSRWCSRSSLAVAGGAAVLLSSAAGSCRTPTKADSSSTI